LRDVDHLLGRIGVPEPVDRQLPQDIRVAAKRLFQKPDPQRDVGFASALLVSRFKAARFLLAGPFNRSGRATLFFLVWKAFLIEIGCWCPQ
jgi:hypothetical protein